MAENNSFCYSNPRPTLAVNCVIIGFDGKQLHVLLYQRNKEPNVGSWSLPGAFWQEGESAESCANSIVQAVTNTKPNYLEQLHFYSNPNRNPNDNIVSISFVACVNMNEVSDIDQKNAYWYPLMNVPPLNFDHNTMVKDCVDILKQRIYFAPIAFKLIGKVFSITELQNLYESLLEKEFDRRNFAKKILSSGILRRAKRPALATSRAQTFYSLNERAYKLLKSANNTIRQEF